MQIIAVVSNKGGVGKSTLVVNLAAELSNHEGKKVAIIDMTVKQKHSKKWAEERENNNKDLPKIYAQSVSCEDFGTVLEACNTNKYTHIFIDVAGVDTQESRAAMSMADIIISPSDSSDFSLSDLIIVNKYIGSVQKGNKLKFGKEIKAYLVPYKIDTRHKMLPKKLKNFDDHKDNFFNMTRTDGVVGKRDDFEKSNKLYHEKLSDAEIELLGQGVTESFKGSLAAKDLMSIFNQIIIKK